jgi:hypothetical protein
MATQYKSLTDIPLSKAHLAQQAALMRLQLFFTGQTHEMILEVARKGSKAIMAEAGEDGTIDAAGLLRAENKITKAWEQMFTAEWLPLFERMRYEAVAISFGRLALYHEKYVVNHKGTKKEEKSPLPTSPGFSETREGGRAEDGKQGRGRRLEEQTEYVFEPQLQVLVDEAAKRIYSDGMSLSSRIWKLDRATRDELNKVLLSGISGGKSAWQLAQEFEKFLGAGQDCPRWTSTRLYKLTKKDIASGDRRGLKTGEECDGRGVAYNALRMARTEIQYAHHLANDAVMESMPWIEKEQIFLSPAHPKPDICDDVIQAGEGGVGIYPKGQVSLPLHPNCLCYKAAITMEMDAFADKMKGWVNGTGAWAEMDTYQKWLGLEDIETSLVDTLIGKALLVWLQGGMDDLMREAGLGL